jgi:hypothetical protein
LSLGLLLVSSGIPSAWIVTGVFLGGQWLDARHKHIPLVLVVPQKGCRFALFQYYVTIFPLSFVPALAQQSAWAWLLIPLHIGLFPGSWGLRPSSILRSLRSRFILP